MRTARYVIRIKDDTPSWYARDAKPRNRQFARFTETCRSLEKDGFDFTVSVSRDSIATSGKHWGLWLDAGDYLTFTILGTAGATVATKPRARNAWHAWPIPAKLTIDQIQRRAIVAQKQIDSDQYFHARTLKFDTSAWRKFDSLLHAAVIDGGFDADETLRENLAAAWCDVADPELGYHASVLRTILHMSFEYVLWELSYVADSPYRSMGCVNPGDHFRYGSDNVGTARKWYTRDTSANESNKTAARDFMAQLPDMRAAETEFWHELEMLSGQRERFAPSVADTLDTRDELAVAA